MAEGMDEAQARVIIARMDEIIDLEVDARAHNGRITDSSYDGARATHFARALLASGVDNEAEIRAGAAILDQLHAVR